MKLKDILDFHSKMMNDEVDFESEELENYLDESEDYINQKGKDG